MASRALPSLLVSILIGLSCCSKAMAASISPTDSSLIEIDGFESDGPLQIRLNVAISGNLTFNEPGGFEWRIDPAPVGTIGASFGMFSSAGPWRFGETGPLEPGPLPNFEFFPEGCCVREYFVSVSVSPTGSTVEMFTPEQYLLSSTATPRLIGVIPTESSPIPIPPAGLLLASGLVFLRLLRSRFNLVPSGRPAKT